MKEEEGSWGGASNEMRVSVVSCSCALQLPPPFHLLEHALFLSEVGAADADTKDVHGDGEEEKE